MTERSEGEAAVLTCEGAPRDLGIDQARWCRASLTAAFRELPVRDRLRLRAGRLTQASARLGRDLRRHFPQQYEAIEGLARGAGVPSAWFVERLASTGGGPANESLAFAASSDWTGAAGLLACALPEGVIARRCHPEGGFASIELIHPWATAPVAGINEGGLAVVAWTDKEPAAFAGGCAAPATLFTHDCLARFERIDGAVDWCLARPAGGAATLLFADRTGEVAAVHVRGSERRVSRPADGLIVQTVGHAREAEIAKALRQASPLLVPDLGRFLGFSLVALDPAECRLGVLRASGAAASERWYFPTRSA